MKNIIVKLLDFEITMPFKREDIIKIFDTLPEYVIEKSKNKNIPVEQAMKAINSEIQTVLEMLNEDDVEIFFNIANEYNSLTMDESNDHELEIMQPEKDKWGFYIRFQISRPLGIDSNPLVFLDKFIIESDSELSLKEAKTLRLRNLENLIYREIAQVSRRVEQVLILAFAELGIGIAYPDNLASAAFLEKIKRESEKDFISRHTKNHEDYYEVPLINLSDKFGVNLFLEKSTP
ncbi:hypothetical protein [Pectobacterium parmentieri]|uniref:Uncharacterized protein n=1 Tax=Pectobacterium parmentieri TaxID=1905730 RepID=A0A8B3FB50_PECPM|nr:hypothetical protein [Pectobacterium parmentieri]AOR58294.1 hypothetical protein A8F97_05175 [Pectobacterium parmentieri]AYH10693.1 hypothetical protein C5E24_13870 [Pectobacterium parmentieri]AYH18596.1 hypothetical protein C5E22_08920 [Pectobacterium parmentieri]AYH36974.1 hypothetical protein C5E17_13615 [Pectobacterium parmentieri]AZS57206.1 hypothetical protein C5E18_14305 [Pectobacterium parmentieri]